MCVWGGGGGCLCVYVSVCLRVFLEFESLCMIVEARYVAVRLCALRVSELCWRVSRSVFHPFCGSTPCPPSSFSRELFFLILKKSAFALIPSLRVQVHTLTPIAHHVHHPYVPFKTMLQTLVAASLRGNRMYMLLITDDIPFFVQPTRLLCRSVLGCALDAARASIFKVHETTQKKDPHHLIKV